MVFSTKGVISAKSLAGYLAVFACVMLCALGGKAPPCHAANSDIEAVSSHEHVLSRNDALKLYKDATARLPSGPKDTVTLLTELMEKGKLPAFLPTGYVFQHAAAE